MSCNKNPASQRKKLLELIAGFAIIAIVLSGLFYFFAMKTVKIQEGQEVVLIDKPLFFGKAGVRPETVKRGRVTVFWTTDIVEVNALPRNLDFTVYAIRLADSRESKYDDGLFSTNLKIRFKITDPVAYASMGIDDWFSHHMRPIFESSVRQEYATIKRAERDKFPAYSTKMNAALLAAFNADLKKVGMPIGVVEVIVE